jgi:hypothetical protein
MKWPEVFLYGGLVTVNVSSENKSKKKKGTETLAGELDFRMRKFLETIRISQISDDYLLMNYQIWIN